MNSSEDILSFIDLLDLDEDLVDRRLNSIMVKASHSNNHLKNALQLLQYKHLINIQEESDCDNNKECDFVVKLIQNVQSDNVDHVCSILKAVLGLNHTTIVSKSEHLLQQILSNLQLPDKVEKETNSTDLMISLRIAESILEAVNVAHEKISLLLLEIPLENILYCYDEKLKVHFLTSVVPKLFHNTLHYSVLDRLWDFIIKLQYNNNEACLQIMSCLSDYYLPSNDTKNIESDIVKKYEFWSIVLLGLNSNDTSVRRIAIYLAKRAVDNLLHFKSNIRVTKENFTIFFLDYKNAKICKQMWENYFILIESLEETQSNIVLPSIQLFECIKNIGDHWLNCCFNIGLKHDNIEVRLKCIENRLKVKFCTENEAKVLLEALNDLNLYNSKEYLKEQLKTFLKDKECLVSIIKVTADIKWSPVPLYHLTDVLRNIKIRNPIDINILSDSIIEILKIHCTNITIRKAVYINVSHFVANNCNNIDWKNYTNLYPLFHFERLENEVLNVNPFVKLIKTISIDKGDVDEFLKIITKTHMNINFALLYFVHHEEYRNMFINEIVVKLRNIQEVTSRQYCKKLECLEDAIYLMQIYTKTYKEDDMFKNMLNMIITKEFSLLLQYLQQLLISDEILNIEQLKLLLKDHTIIIQNDMSMQVLELFKSAILLLKDKNTEISKKVFALTILDCLIIENKTISTDLLNHIDKILTVEAVVGFAQEIGTINNTENGSKFKNIFYEESCIIINKIMNKNFNANMVINYIDKVIDCGGYGCLKWILRIINNLLDKIVKDTKFNFPQFLNRSWKEIEELKSNNQYTPCIEEFIKILTHDEAVIKEEYNNIIISYCSKIIEYGPARNTPLYFLARELNKKDILTPQLVYVLCEMLLYNPVPKKDQRITENVEIEIKKDANLKLKESSNNHHNYEIQYLALCTLSKVQDIETLKIIVNMFFNKINEIFKNKVRYHGNSQTHRTVLTALQNILFITLLDSRIIDDNGVNWCLKLLGKLPHQPSVKICLEWYISLCLYLQKEKLDSNLLKMFASHNIPLPSQFMILYWLMKHKLLASKFVNDEYDFVMDTLLSHTMGQMFNIRLNAQYLATKLYNLNKNSAIKYTYIIGVIEKTFAESKNDKNFTKLRNDFFVNNFDMIHELTPYFIYECVSKLSDASFNEERDLDFIKTKLTMINENIGKDDVDDLKREWLTGHALDTELDKFERVVMLDHGEDNNKEIVGTIQKKYIPWKNMSDVNTYDCGKKRESNSNLIVVASLIDKLPNLGGMARTSEVFGVKTYIVDSLRHLQDKQFQGLSVSAERWVDVQEVRPGRALKEYLSSKKAEGYSIVAAEQTSTSCKLQSFQFPVKTLLLLGHEKEGVPCDLLPLMDYCVEIPQQGVVRSLNVHVTAAIFVWEYTRQTVLRSL